MRTRSQPVSPGGLVSLDDMPRRRRATRSASAQPQEADPAESAQASQPTEPQPTTTRTRQTRVGKASRRRKGVTRVAEDEDDDARRRNRSSYDDIARRRRKEAGGRVDKTLYRLDDLLAQAEVDDEDLASKDCLAVPTDVDTPVIDDAATPTKASADDHQTASTDVITPAVNDSVDLEMVSSNDHGLLSTDLVAPATPEKTSPSTPKTAPPLVSDASPGWSNWVFDHVARRWTGLWDRLSGQTPEPQPAVQNTTFPVTPTKAGPSTQHDPPASAGPFAQTTPAPPAPQAAQSARRASYRRPSLISRRSRQQSRPSRPVRLARQEQTVKQTLHPRRRPITKHERFDYGARPSFRADLLEHYLTPSGASVSSSEVHHDEQNLNAIYPCLNLGYTPAYLDLQSIDTIESTTIESTTNDGTKLGKRKRGSPEVIPNPPGCSYGFDPDYFIIDSDDEEEAERDKARRVAAAVEAAKGAKEFAEQTDALNGDAEDELPAAKRARVSEPYRRRPTTRQAGNASITTSTKTSIAPSSIHDSLVSPSQRPGFIPNSRHTYQAPDLSTIDSSGLLGDYPETPKPETPKPETPRPETTTHQASIPQAATPQATTPQAATPQAATPQASTTQPYQHQVSEDQEPQEGQTQNDLSQISEVTAIDTDDDFSPLTRARNKAEQFKPKTPSRLRETYRFSSNNSTPLSFLGTTTPAHTAGKLSTENRFDDSLMSLDSSMIESPSSWLYEVCPSGDLHQLSWPTRAALDFQPLVAAQLAQESYQKTADEATTFWRTLLKT